METFNKIKRVSKRESTRLGKEITQVLLYYRFRDNGHRYKHIDLIPEIPSGKQLSLPGDSPEERVSFLLSQAAWVEKKAASARTVDVVDAVLARHERRALGHA